MKTFPRLLVFLKPMWKGVVLAVFLNVVTIACAIGLMGTSAYLISYAALQPSIAYLEVAIVGVRFFGISRGVFRYLERLASHSVNLRLLANVRIWLYQKLEPLVPARTLEYQGGDLLALLTADVDTLENLFIRIAMPPLTALLVMAGMGLVLGSLSVRLAAILWAAVLVGGAILPVILYWISRRGGATYIRARAELNSQVASSLEAAGELGVYGADGRALDSLQAVSNRFGSSQMQLARVNGFGSGAMTWVMNFCILGVLAASIPLVNTGGISGITLAVIVLMTTASFEALLPIIQTAQSMESVLTAGRRIFTIADSKPAVSEPQETILKPARGNDILIENLSFRYPAGVNSALENIDIQIREDEKIAIVGPSGSGKSTLANLLVRTWDYNTGSIQLGGVELSSLCSADIWQRIGILSQNPIILTDTLRRNLQIGSEIAENSTLAASLEEAGLAEWFGSLPNGLDTWLGERGAKMSAGERQRLAIARMNLRNTPVRIFDEPTANLDVQSEKKILELAMSCSKKCLLIWITHRLVGLERMDAIVFMEQGRIIERGTQRELLARGGRYAQFFELQNLWLENLRD